eukprot:TRINITY_DN47968_c0_g1_i1.p1 TRINITY_DN47968_c0_g1~~TRINITY_DN47968_c0_g1_i1.p1  ORF type:complete len:484 (+),score=59.79 TRINITY_DN47968_c0_g1_i1:61-1512(+)
MIRLAFLCLQAHLQLGRKTSCEAERKVDLFENFTRKESSTWFDDEDEEEEGGDLGDFLEGWQGAALGAAAAGLAAWMQPEDSDSDSFHDTSEEHYSDDEPPTPQRSLFQIADLHGDFAQLERLMTKLGLVEIETTRRGEQRWAWSGEDAIVVFTGDYVDRGLDSAKILMTLDELKTKAEDSGGDVVMLQGNHEQMLIKGDYRYMQLTDARNYMRVANLRSEDLQRSIDRAYFEWYSRRRRRICLNDPRGHHAKHKHPTLLHKALDRVFSENEKVGQLLRSMRRIRVIRDLREPIVFVHGGITYSHLRQLSRYMQRRDSKFSLATSPESNSEYLEDFMGTHDFHGADPLWDRSVAGVSKDDEETCEDIRRTLRALAATRMVLGHTTESEYKEKDAFGCRCDCKVILTDRAMSRSLASSCLKDSYEGQVMKPVSALYSNPDGQLFTLIEKLDRQDIGSHAWRSKRSDDDILEDLFDMVEISALGT